MERPSAGHRAGGAYVFVCYSHRDAGRVLPLIRTLQDRGVHCWLDERIAPGEEWTEELGRAIDGAERLVYFVTPDAVASRHCRNEVLFANAHGTPILAVHLAETGIPMGLELVLGSSQAIMAAGMDPAGLCDRLLDALAPETDAGRVSEPVAAPLPAHRKPAWRRLAPLAGALMVAVGAVAAYVWRAENTGSERPLKVAVFDLHDLSASRDLDWLAAGISSEVRRHLTSVGDFDVLPAALVRHRDLGELDEGVDLAIDGTIQDQGDIVEVTIETVDVATGERKWSTQVTGEDADPIALQKRISSEIARYFGDAIGAESWGPSNPEAYAAFLKYLQFAHSGIPEESRVWLQETLRLEPGFANGWLDLAGTHLRFAGSTGDWAYVDQARDAMENARRLTGAELADPGLRGTLRAWFDGELSEGEVILRRHGDAFRYARLMLSSGLAPEAERYFETFLRRNPHHSAWDIYGVSLLMQGDFQGAVAASRRCARYGPPRSYNCHTGQVWGLPHIDPEAAQRLRDEIADTQRIRKPGSVTYELNRRSIGYLEIGLALARGDRDTALTTLEALEHIVPERYAVNAGLFLLLGDPRGEVLLHKLSQTRSPRAFIVAYERAELPPEVRRHPAFQRYLASLGFTDAWRLELCRRAALWPKDSGIGCNPEKYSSADAIPPETL